MSRGLGGFLGSYLVLLIKATWHHTLKSSEKTTWDSIMEMYREQYGVHLDPRTAY